MPHNCSNQWSGNDKMVVYRAYHKKYHAKNREQILAQQKRYRTEIAEILKSRRKCYENDRERLASSQRTYYQQNKDRIRNYQKQYCKNNRERVNEYWRCSYAKNKEQINQRLCDQKQRKTVQNIVRFGAWDKESEKLERSLVLSVTLCGRLTVKT